MPTAATDLADLADLLADLVALATASDRALASDRAAVTLSRTGLGGRGRAWDRAVTAQAAIELPKVVTDRLLRAF